MATCGADTNRWQVIIYCNGSGDVFSATYPRSLQLGQTIKAGTRTRGGLGSLFRHFHVLPMDKAVRSKTIMLQASDH